MKFITFETPGAPPRVGVMLDDGGALDLGQLAAASPNAAYAWGTDLVQLIAAGRPALEWVRRALADHRPAAVVAAGGFSLLAPIPRPRKNVVCVGLNYQDHVAEGDRRRREARPLPTTPVFFTKPPTAVIGPGAVIPWHPVTGQLDYEVELGVVIGRAGRDIAPEHVTEHIFGYTIVNDVTARDLQAGHGGQWFKGKGLDGSCPLGPWIVQAAALPHAARLDFASRVNGEVRQQSNTARMIFDVPTLVSTLSAGLTLEPGDILATGTCAGVGAGFQPPRFLSDGDVVEMEIEGIGTLRNQVRRVNRG